MTNRMPPVCDYEGSDYKRRFWDDGERNYEDGVERVALQRLMPPVGKNIIEIGAGFGRLADEYSGYERVVLFDYSRTLLREAQAHLGEDPRYIYVAGNWYNMPFVPGLFSTVVQVRTLHHAADVPAVFNQLYRISRPHGDYILEFASKRHIKSVIRYIARRQDWSPFEEQPVEFVELNFDFHPAWIRQRLEEVGFIPGRTLTVSHFRVGLLKRMVPTPLLVKIDSLAQLSGNWWQLTPSVFIKNKKIGLGVRAGDEDFFACPECQTPLGLPGINDLICTGCGRKWTVKDGLYDFKEPA